MELIRADLLPAALFALVFPLLFLGGELVRRRLPADPELSRKFVHFGGGMAALFFPFVFRSPETVPLLALLLAGIILVTKHKGVLRSVHGVARRSSGAVYFPLAITLLYLLGRDRQVFYVIAVLVLTMSDSLAALAGTRYGAITYDVEEGRKSLEGSLVFFFVTFLCAQLPLLLLTDLGRPEAVLIALVIAILVTGFEAISLEGSDNIFVPLGTFFILVKMARLPLATILEHTAILLLIIVVTIGLTVVQKVFKPSGLVGMILVSYAAWSLGDVSWFLPVLLAQLLLSGLVLRFREQVPEDITNYQVRVLFYSAIVPVVLLFAANASGSYRELYLPFVGAAVSQISLIFAYFLSIAPGTTPLGQRLRDRALLRGGLCTAVATGVIGLLPLALYAPGPLWLAALQVMLAALVAFGIFHRATARLADNGSAWLMRQRIRMVASAVAAGALLLVQFIGR
jgi:dolichol kinase